jgi:hypothetical protein
MSAALLFRKQHARWAPTARAQWDRLDSRPA